MTQLATRPLLLTTWLLFASNADAAELIRRPIENPSAVQDQGWLRVRLDAQAQRQRDQLWLGDAQGRSTPFVFEREDLWQTQTLELDQILAGKDEQGRPSYEFSVKVPEGWRMGDRRHLELEVELQASTNYVARAIVHRRLEDGAWLESDRDYHLYDLGSAGHQQKIVVPWDGERYRLVIQPRQGSVQSVENLKVRAKTVLTALGSTEIAKLSPKPDPKLEDHWRIELDGSYRVVALDVELVPPVAPVAAQIEVETERGRSPAFERRAHANLLWNLPALESSATRINIRPTMTDTLRIRLPSGATIESVRVHASNEALIFPAEAGQNYFVHLGGQAQRAPGDLRNLPSSRVLHTANALELGPAQPDPHGIAIEASPSERTRPWLAWIVAAVVAGLGYVAWRLLKSTPTSSPPDHG